jgi:hypothetical protein
MRDEIVGEARRWQTATGGWPRRSRKLGQWRFAAAAACLFAGGLWLGFWTQAERRNDVEPRWVHPDQKMQFQEF